MAIAIGKSLVLRTSSSNFAKLYATERCRACSSRLGILPSRSLAHGRLSNYTNTSCAALLLTISQHPISTNGHRLFSLFANFPLTMSSLQNEDTSRNDETRLSTPSESTPLLSNLQREESAHETQPNRYPYFPYAVILVGLFSLVADVGGALVDMPEIRLLEMAVCRDYYRIHDPSVIGSSPLAYVPEHLCKVRDIQRDLAYLRATKSLLTNLPGGFYPSRLI